MKKNYKQGVYFVKDGEPVENYEKGVEDSRLLIIGKYCRFFLSTVDLGKENFEMAQVKAASLGDGWKCPDSFQGRTIGLMSKEIRKKAEMLHKDTFEKIEWFWTNEKYDRWTAASVYFRNGRVYNLEMYNYYTSVLALSAFQD